MGKRRRARELALQFLFQIDMNPPGRGGAHEKGLEVDGAQDPEENNIPVKDNSKSHHGTIISTTEDAAVKDAPAEDVDSGASKPSNKEIPEKTGLENDGTLDPEMERAIDVFKANFKTDETAIPFFIFLVRGVCRHRERIDRIINDTSENWKLDRMGVVDRNILRFAIFELMFADDIPSNVSMNEAIEIAKRYGTADSPSFINGILDRIASVEKKGERKDPKD